MHEYPKVHKEAVNTVGEATKHIVKKSAAGTAAILGALGKFGGLVRDRLSSRRGDDVDFEDVDDSDSEFEAP